MSEIIKAVIKTGGKQYSVEKGSILNIEKLEAQIGEEIVLNQVLLIDDGELSKIGSPYLNDVTAIGEVIKQFKAPKVIIFKKQRRQNYRRKNGHRQNYSLIKIKDIKVA